jgi:glycosyltransferase involved in cell wall biosynthesis
VKVPSTAWSDVQAYSPDSAPHVPPNLNPTRPKVLHVGKFYPPHMGGMETHLEALCGELRKSLDLHVLVASDDGSSAEEVLEGVPVSRVPTRLHLSSTPICPGMVARIRNSDADIIHIHLPNPGAVLAYLASRNHGRLVVTYHSDTVRQKFLGAMFAPWLHAALRHSSAVIATSADYQQTSPVLARYRNRCHVIPYGIPLEQFEHSDASEVAAVRQRHGDRLVISVGRLVYYKGFEYLIQAMTSVRGTLIIVGDGPLRLKLESLAASLGVREKIVFAGEIQNERLVPYYHAADVFALASVARSEAFGIVQIEAMAAGIPVVNTRLDSGVPFVSLHEKTGLTVPPADPHALAEAINRLLDQPDLRRSLGAAARARARQEFSIDVMTARTLALYDRVMSYPRSTPVSPGE